MTDLSACRLERLAGDRVRRHLEEQNNRLMSMLQQAGTSGFSKEEAMQQLAQDNGTLEELLAQESAAKKRFSRF